MADGMVDLFYSYSHKDEELRDQLDGHLALLKRRGVLRVWHDRKISAGDEWRNEIDAELERADIVLLLISADFLASDYCYDVEMKRALARDTARQARVIPVIVRACDGLDDAPFAHLQALPKDRRPVTSWQNRDEAWVDVARGIRLSVKELPKRPDIDPRTPAPEVEPTQPEPEVEPTVPEPEIDPSPPEPEIDPTTPTPEVDPPAPGPEVTRAERRLGEWPHGEAAEASMRGSLVQRILRKLSSGVAKGVIVGMPDKETRPAQPRLEPTLGDTSRGGSRPGLQPPRAGPLPAAPSAPARARPPVAQGKPSAREDAARARRADELVRRLISDFSGRVRSAYAGRNAGALYVADAAIAAGEALAAIREQKRILWVDDAPAGNAQEVSALLGLQIEVQQVTSTQAALDALAAADTPFDLVISDWNRVPRVEQLTPEGVRLLRLMRRAGIATPLLYYHGELDDKRARTRAQQARREGAIGAANLPGELFALVLAALGNPGGAGAAAWSSRPA
jgi:CheY-like chemotaxis protein